MKQKTKEVVINTCFGGFGLSEAAYKKLIEWGIPVRAYTEEPRNPKTGLYDIRVPENEGEIIFDRNLSDDEMDKTMTKLAGRYWETWLSSNRSHPLLVRVVKELGKKANGRCAELKVIEIPANVEYSIEEYDGREHIAEQHNTWY